MNILLTGANGYIGRRLLPALVQDGHKVYCLVRDKRRFNLPPDLSASVEIVEGDLSDSQSLQHLPQQIDAAYYLVHSLGNSYKNFGEQEASAAANFANYLSQTSAQHLVYLSGISNDTNLSEHLQSRFEVENILRQSGVPLTVLRAAIIIGSGSASFEIIRDLVEKLPFMITPKWVNSRCQPIAIRNVITYLQHILLLEPAYNKVFDIGGPDVLTYKQMMLQYAEVRKLKRAMIEVPFFSPKLSSYWLYFVTNTTYMLARNLVDSMKNEVIVEHKGIEDLISIPLMPYREAVKQAFRRIEQNEVVSSWKDAVASGVIHKNYLNVHVPEWGCLKDQRTISFTSDPEQVLKNIWSIGGQRGWYYLNSLWKIRGFLDKMVGGVGLRRGRRSEEDLAPGDALDFWRVLVADKASRRVVLYAEMKLPGEAWLEFRIEDAAKGVYTLVQTATFRPKGLLGRMYWYSLVPLHHFIFKGMAKQVAIYR
jgi:uncharacterized protein YbjT (DUF2867 family)